jgi:predicted aspartyl protease
MKQRLASVAVLGLLLIAACAGVKARETVLMPVMAQAWSTVLSLHVEVAATTNALEGVDPELLRSKSAAMQAALNSGDRYSVVAADWALLRPAALAGVQARVTANEIGAGVGMSIVETVRQFDVRMTQLLGR